MTSVSPSTTGQGRLPEQRTAVITGAGGPAGIGRVTARILAENGWHVALVDINTDGLAAVETELRDAGHHGVLAVPTDIASGVRTRRSVWQGARDRHVDDDRPAITPKPNTRLGSSTADVENAVTAPFQW